MPEGFKECTPAQHRAALIEALDRDHPGCSTSSDLRGCDICAAIRAGFPECAAHLLIGATETPALGAFLDEYGSWAMRDGFPVDWRLWVDWHRTNTRKCFKCRGFTWTDESDSDSCAHCLAHLPNDPGTVDARRAARGLADSLGVLSGDEVGDGSPLAEECRRVAVHLRALAGWFDEVAKGQPGAGEVAKVAALARGDE